MNTRSGLVDGGTRLAVCIAITAVAVCLVAAVPGTSDVLDPKLMVWWFLYIGVCGLLLEGGMHATWRTRSLNAVVLGLAFFVASSLLYVIAGWSVSRIGGPAVGGPGLGVVAMKGRGVAWFDELWKVYAIVAVITAGFLMIIGRGRRFWIDGLSVPPERVKELQTTINAWALVVGAVGALVLAIAALLTVQKG